MTETQLWNKFRQWWPGWCQRIDARSIKGLPDVHWTYGGKSGWFELKIGAQLQTGQLKLHKIRLEQCMWLNGYTRAGGCCGILVWFSSLNVFMLLQSTEYRRMMVEVAPESVVWRSSTMDQGLLKVVQ